MDNSEVASILNEIGLLLEIKGESFFKSKAYYEAARTIEKLETDIEKLIANNELNNLKGIGEAISKKIIELVKTGKLEYYQKLKAEIPNGMLNLLRIPGLGPKKIKIIHDKLGITNIEDLKYACIENKLVNIPGFGQKTQTKILENIEKLNKYASHFYYFVAEKIADELLNYLSKCSDIIRLSTTGSLRRKKEVVTDIDILASSNNKEYVVDYFIKHPAIKTIEQKTSSKTTVILEEGISVDFRVVSDEEYPFALHYYTGNDEHIESMRKYAKHEGFNLKQRSLYKNDIKIICSTEDELYSTLGLQYIHPELRESSIEIKFAKTSGLPSLIENSDIIGIFHVHTTYSDGTNNLKDIAKYCMDQGYKYIGIADHSKSAFYAGGLSVEDIKRQHEEIDILNTKFTDFKILKGIELDILPDGELDYDNEILSWFDFTIASVHSSFNLSEQKMTERVIKALKNPYVKILGHPTGRLLLAREPFKINLEKIFQICAEKNVLLEINANPHRLDLDWRYLRIAKNHGCKFVIGSDAHNRSGISDVAYGVNIARKGWLTKADIINTKNLNEVIQYFKK